MKAEIFAILEKKAQEKIKKKIQKSKPKPKPKSKLLSMPKIKKIVFDFYKIKKNKSNCRKREYVIARQVSCYFIKKIHPRNSLNLIGKKVFGLDHATVLYSIRQVNNIMETDKNFKAEIEEIGKLLNVQK